VAASNIRFAVAVAPQHKTWSEYRAAAIAADELGFEAFWSWDHLMPVWGDMEDSAFECYTTLSALAEATRRIRVGALVSGAPYRNAGMQIKMATQVDIVSNGRFDFGIGAAWAEREFRAFDIPFPEPKDRIRILRETLDLAKLLWSGDPRKIVSYQGKFVRATDAFLNPQPVQKPHPPIVVGGGGEQLTLRVVARHADVWHGAGDLPELKRKIDLIDGYAGDYGREGSDIAKSTYAAIWVGDLPDEVAAGIAGASRQPADQVRASILSGEPEAIEARLREYMDIGITYFILRTGDIVDLKNWKRIAKEIIPRFSTT
jgi:alkanesulfonate monooxygenase SsuD/methylene tetrahydromethanopterin reductase-like flavin-dependent oxidoreductase (luciferase family)